MRFELNGEQVFASTGGRDHRPGQDWIIFIHGAGGSHLVWSQQVRAFAYDNYNVLAVDFPGHGDSRGEPLDSVEAMAKWVLAVMNKLKIAQAHIVGHSLGGPVILEIAANNPKKVKSATFISSAMTIGVSETLLETSKSNPQKAYQMMHSGFFGRFGQVHDNSVPGTSLIGSGLQIMAHNRNNALAADLLACVSYENGIKAAKKVLCPALCLLSGRDAMVGLKSGKQLCEILADSKQIVFEGAGHMLTGESPREINQQLRQFYSDRF
jgi:pimeloyl-ACP methyl ester carboxylesterase